jgi:hypothetical protein
MRRTLITIAVAATATFGLAAAAVPSADATPALASSAHHAKRVCAAARPGEASCLAEELVDTATGARVNPLASAGSAARPAAISGKTPSDIRSAYGLTSTGSSGRTVAIVDAYGYPNASRDLAVYRSQFGLSACTTANGCLTVVSQTGSSSLPAYNLGWSQEQALDLDAVSATCPDCKILLVQAKTPSFANLGAAVKTAAAHAGVVAISNSYGGGDSADSSYGSYYNHPGVAVTASTGDNGYQGASFPASSHYVTAVGGTSLTKTTSTRGWSESAWSGSDFGRDRLQRSGDRRRLRGRRPQHRPRRLRTHVLERVVLGPVRRHEPLVAHRRRGLRPQRPDHGLRQHPPVCRVRRPQRRDLRQQRLLRQLLLT